MDIFVSVWWNGERGEAGGEFCLERHKFLLNVKRQNDKLVVNVTERTAEDNTMLVLFHPCFAVHFTSFMCYCTVLYRQWLLTGVVCVCVWWENTLMCSCTLEMKDLRLSACSREAPQCHLLVPLFSQRALFLIGIQMKHLAARDWSDLTHVSEVCALHYSPPTPLSLAAHVHLFFRRNVPTPCCSKMKHWTRSFPKGGLTSL